MSDELWSSVEPTDWQAVPCTAGRVATEEDVRVGRAVFYLQNAAEIGASAMPLSLPLLAKVGDGDD